MRFQYRKSKILFCFCVCVCVSLNVAFFCVGLCPTHIHITGACQPDYIKTNMYVLLCSSSLPQSHFSYFTFPIFWVFLHSIQFLLPSIITSFDLLTFIENYSFFPPYTQPGCDYTFFNPISPCFPSSLSLGLRVIAASDNLKPLYIDHRGSKTLKPEDTHDKTYCETIGENTPDAAMQRHRHLFEFWGFQ